MINEKKLIAFGPVPSRRLGKSLGINNIPPKSCTYSCVYCQLGRTSNIQVERGAFYKPKEIVRAVGRKVEKANKIGESIDYLTFVPDGEPTLDINLGKEIELLRSLGIKIAVITNASLIWEKKVQEDLKRADWVSLKIDTVDRDIWYRINRPHGSLKLEKIMNSISEFSQKFDGELVTETMLVEDVNDSVDALKETASFISGLKTKKSYISIPTRPPAEHWAKPPKENTIVKIYNLFKEKGVDIEYLIGYEGNAFAYTGDLKKDILGIASVHPIREEGMKELLDKSGSNWDVVKKLIDDDKLVETVYRNKRFYMRKIVRRNN